MRKQSLDDYESYNYSNEDNSRPYLLQQNRGSLNETLNNYTYSDYNDQQNLTDPNENDYDFEYDEVPRNKMFYKDEYSSSSGDFQFIDSEKQLFSPNTNSANYNVNNNNQIDDLTDPINNKQQIINNNSKKLYNNQNINDEKIIKKNKEINNSNNITNTTQPIFNNTFFPKNSGFDYDYDETDSYSDFVNEMNDPQAPVFSYFPIPNKISNNPKINSNNNNNKNNDNKTNFISYDQLTETDDDEYEDFTNAIRSQNKEKNFSENNDYEYIDNDYDSNKNDFDQIYENDKKIHIPNKSNKKIDKTKDQKIYSSPKKKRKHEESYEYNQLSPQSENDEYDQINSQLDNQDYSISNENSNQINNQNYIQNETPDYSQIEDPDYNQAESPDYSQSETQKYGYENSQNENKNSNQKSDKIPKRNNKINQNSNQHQNQEYIKMNNQNNRKTKRNEKEQKQNLKPKQIQKENKNGNIDEITKKYSKRK